MANYPKLSQKEIERFWSHVDIRSDDECWNWEKSTSTNGYGQVNFRGDMFRAHRIAWSLANKKEPGALMVCHSCDNPICCNPNHLFLGSALDNVQDAIDKHHFRSVQSVPNYGEANGRATLKSDDIVSIRNLHKLGYSQSYIARKLGIHQTTVSKILHGKRWSHIL